MTVTREDLARYQQAHLLRWFDELSEEQQRALTESISAIDFTELTKLTDKFRTDDSDSEPDDTSESPAVRAGRAIAPSRLVRLSDLVDDPQRAASARAVGNEMLKAGRVGVILVAGGQGSRLGFPHPKGMYPIGPVSQSPLFRILAEQLLARGRRADVVIPYYIMTSQATHDATVRFFEEQKWFGLAREQVHFFQQGSMPAVDGSTGQILLSSRSELALSPDGHGGLLKALANHGLLEHMAANGVDTLFYHQVDNPTARVCDPVFLGLHEQADSQLSTRVVAKRDPSEKMGVVVEVDGKTQIIEYSDLPADLATKQDAAGQPIFWAGNTAIHAFDRSFLEELAAAPERLPFHLARKNVAYVDDAGVEQTPNDKAHPNAVKFERFIFDALPEAERTLVVEADREREFNPVKNAEGPDSPATARQALLRIHRSWLEQAGAQLDDEARIEISPLFALEAEDVAEHFSTDLQIGGDVFLNAATD